MKRMATAGLVAAVMLAAALPARAAVQVVDFDQLIESTRLDTPLRGGDALVLDSFAAGQRGRFDQSITFTLASAAYATGEASWNVVRGGSRLLGVDIDLLDADGNVVFSDSFAGRAAGVRTSLLAGALGPGTYTLHATGRGARDASLDLSLAFAVPEPATVATMGLGLALVMLTVARRRRR
ncbi:PEP-CTERM sorting domain-containing protein [Rubrivivax gelatinosus]|uniref:Ice-binding protein C-terminal domain-containing protein n=2 Tax=Rubrivivax gelatinosus TaxID=28068 RepID=A0ABS1DWI4_RUBGE|nr:PEP-CTERM sorting domain-containing protein [Rubrivivax gelatinosus]MBK1713132.1 hypothetical protein [Rubrivivax gelatinosus]